MFLRASQFTYKCIITPNVRAYSLCCPLRPPPGQCEYPNLVPGGGRRIAPLSSSYVRAYSLCCPLRPLPGQCGCPKLVPGGGRRIVPLSSSYVRAFSLCCPPRPPPGQCGCLKLVPDGGRRVIPLYSSSLRAYSLCCPPRPPPGQCGCPNPVPGGGRRIVPPSSCRPGPIPPNPCVPVFHHGKDTWKKYKYISFFVCIPLIIVQACRALGHELPHKGECRDYEYMRMRSKRFPWGDGVKSFYHNDHVNHLPGECVPPPLDCD